MVNLARVGDFAIDSSSVSPVLLGGRRGGLTSSILVGARSRVGPNDFDSIFDPQLSITLFGVWLV